MLHIPILRRGRSYRSLDVARVAHHRTGLPFVEISQANPGLIRRDLLDQRSARRALAGLEIDTLVRICEQAAELFARATLPLGDGRQSPGDYVEHVSATTGLPHVLVRRNMEKIRAALSSVRQILAGLTRHLDLRVLDTGIGVLSDGQPASFFPRSDSLGVVLPSNSPGVHSLWVPAIALKIPLVLKPGGAEPWTPYRIAQALIAAGCPPDALGYYPTDHSGAAEILRHCGRSMLFGDSGSTGAWRGDPRIEIHGPGFSKVVIGADCIDSWQEYLDVMVASVADNGGRSCVNASSIWAPRHAAAIAEALAHRLSAIVPRAADDDQALLAPFVDAAVAERLSELIDEGLATPGAREVTAAHRQGGRLVRDGRCTYLLPTVIECAPGHPLANREFLFPYTSVVQVSEVEIPECLGPSLVVTAITSDEALTGRLLASPLVDRLNLGPVPTTHISWDQPHEGNLFEHLYGRRAFQRSA